MIVVPDHIWKKTEPPKKVEEEKPKQPKPKKIKPLILEEETKENSMELTFGEELHNELTGSGQDY